MVFMSSFPARVDLMGYIPPCIPTRAYKVPAGPDWVHEIKHDGYRQAEKVDRLPT
jgi:ATP-dependent DNA ligase